MNITPFAAAAGARSSSGMTFGLYKELKKWDKSVPAPLTVANFQQR
jgi:hypothetical protein